MSFMLGSLSAKLAPLGRLDLLDDVAKKAVTYYDRRDDNRSDADLATRALARRNLGEVLAAQGHAAAALAEYRASLAITRHARRQGSRKRGMAGKRALDRS